MQLKANPQPQLPGASFVECYAVFKLTLSFKTSQTGLPGRARGVFHQVKIGQIIVAAFGP
jgi:hypothetical protein